MWAKLAQFGLDIAKSVFQVHGVDADGVVVIRKRVTRAKMLEFFAALYPAWSGIEACPKLHIIGAVSSQALGYTCAAYAAELREGCPLSVARTTPTTLPPSTRAVTRPSMRFVPTKSEQQQSGLMLHRSRQLLVRQRTMLSNAIRGHMAEPSIGISAKGRNGTAELPQGAC